MRYLLYLYMLLIPVIMVRKHKRYGYMLFFDFSTWLTLFGYFYLVLPGLFIGFANDLMQWSFSESDINLALFCSLYFETVFFCTFLLTPFSQNYLLEIREDIQFTKLTLQAAWLISVSGAVLCLLILIKDGGALRASVYDRVEAGGAFQEIEEKYKLRSVFFLMVTSTVILFLKYKKIRFLLLIIPFILLEAFSGGRTLSFIVMIVFYINIVLVKKKTYILPFIILMFLLLSYVLIFRDASQAVSYQEGLFAFGYSAFGEFINTYMTIPYIIQNNLQNLSSPLKLIENIYSGLLPGFLKQNMDLFLGGRVLAKQIGKGFGLAQNVVSESLLHGGWWLFSVMPFLIVIVYKTINYFCIRMGYLGYTLFVLNIVYIRLIMREGTLYLSIPIYIFLMYSFFTFFDFTSTILQRKRSSSK